MTYKVELLGVPHYRQGEHDSLCLYYTTAMMLAALYPRFARDFGEIRRGRRHGRRAQGKRIDDPIIQHYRTQKSEREVMGSWFFGGEHFEKAHKILNRIMNEYGYRTRFGYEGNKYASDSTWSFVTRSIDIGLPVMLGWDTEDFGCHAVLVTGYWCGKKDWFLLNDPGGDSEVCWQNLKEDKNSNFEVVTCIADSYRGPRPDKSESHNGTDTVFRWTPDQEYVPIDEYFE